MVLDVSDLDAAERAVRAAATTLDGIVHAAGISPRTAFPEVDEAEWGRVVEVNLSAPFLLTQRLLDVLVDGGAIVNVTSAAAANVLATSGTFTPSYSAAKAGFASVTASLAAALGPRGIRVNAVAPGFIATDMTARTTPTRGAGSRIDATRPVGRGGGGGDVIAFLLGDAAAFITGVTMPVDGGVTLGVLRYPGADGTIRATPARRWCDPRGSVSETFWGQTPERLVLGSDPARGRRTETRGISVVDLERRLERAMGRVAAGCSIAWPASSVATSLRRSSVAVTTTPSSSRPAPATKPTW